MWLHCTRSCIRLNLNLEIVVITLKTKTLELVLMIFFIYAALQVTKGMDFTGTWLLNEIIRFLICCIVVVIVLFITNRIFKRKEK